MREWIVYRAFSPICRVDVLDSGWFPFASRAVGLLAYHLASGTTVTAGSRAGLAEKVSRATVGPARLLFDYDLREPAEDAR
jgi:hypothetical protein